MPQSFKSDKIFYRLVLKLFNFSVVKRKEKLDFHLKPIKTKNE